MEKWDYEKMNKSEGSYWNDRPLDEQLSLLEEFYPIGMIVKTTHIGFDVNDNDNYIITNHVSPDDEDGIVGNSIIEIENVEDHIPQILHPGFLLPTKQWLRSQKLNELI